MSIVSHNLKTDYSDEMIQNNDLNRSVDSFISKFEVVKHLYRCGAGKARGVAISVIFTYLLKLVFMNKSMYMQMHQGKFTEAFSKNAVYRFLDNPKANWQKYTIELSADIINNMLRDLTSKERRDAFVVDDSLFERTSCKKTELGSRVFDHVSMKYRKGYRLMTLGWTDGNTFLPVNSSLLASSKESNLIGPIVDFDGRSLATRRRKLARMKGTDVMIELLKTAQSAGHKADYVLFDTWFSSPAQLLAVKALGLDSIAMIKKSSRIYYEYEGEQLSINKIFGISKKRRGRSKYLLSVNVMIGKDQKIPAKIVCVRNKKNKKDWIAFICTNPDLSEEEIIRIYGKRWQIEVFFKTCKSFLQLITECHSLSYDALTAHVAIVFTRYLMIAMEQRRCEDDRTLGEIFFFFTDELTDITFGESFQIIITAMIDSVCAIFQPTEEQLALFIDMFVGRLPDYIRNSLTKAVLTA